MYKNKKVQGVLTQKTNTLMYKFKSVFILYPFTFTFNVRMCDNVTCAFSLMIQDRCDPAIAQLQTAVQYTVLTDTIHITSNLKKMYFSNIQIFKVTFYSILQNIQPVFPLSGNSLLLNSIHKRIWSL